MKLGAMQRITLDDRDFSDAVNLAIECGVTTVDELRQVFQGFFGGKSLPPRAEARLDELARAVAVKAASRSIE